MKSLTASVLVAGLTVTSAAAQTQAALQVGATVVAHCRIAAVDGDAGIRGPMVTASCGAADLRALRVSTSRGERLRPIDGRRLRAGGDAMFVVSRAEGSDRLNGGVLVTLDF